MDGPSSSGNDDSRNDDEHSHQKLCSPKIKDTDDCSSEKDESRKRETFLTRLRYGASQFLDLLHESENHDLDLSSLNVISDIVLFLKNHTSIPQSCEIRSSQVGADPDFSGQQSTQIVLAGKDVEHVIGNSPSFVKKKEKSVRNNTLTGSASEEIKGEIEKEHVGVRKSTRKRKPKRFSWLNDDSADEWAPPKELAIKKPNRHATGPVRKPGKRGRGRPSNTSKYDTSNKCGMCYKLFPSRSALKSHIPNHLKADPFECMICKESFDDAASLLTHVSSHLKDSEVKLVCWICGQTSLDLTKHLEEHPDYFEYKCDMCPERFTDLFALNEHWTTHGDSENTDIVITRGGASGPRRTNTSSENLSVTQNKVNCKCVPCNKCFDSAAKLKAHYQDVHANESQAVECKICNKMFSSLQVLVNHAPKHSLQKTCYICGKEFENLSNHLITHESEFDFGCGDCDKNFPNMSLLQSHLMSVHIKGYALECEECGKVFKRPQGLAIHKQIHQTPRPESSSTTHQCKRCLRQFVRRGPLLTHKCVSRAGDGDVMTCQICGQMFQDNKLYAVHMDARHSSERKLICEFCDEAFESSKDLMSHRSEKHLESREPFLCVPCEKAFGKQQELLDHIKESKCHASVECELCGQQFPRKYELNVHTHLDCSENETTLEISTLKKIHECKICFRKFSLFSSLAFHSTQHPRNKTCWICGKVCKHLSIHMRQHYDLFEFACGKCEKKFPNKALLQSHEATHLEISPYVCSICDKVFGRANRLSRHMLTHEANRKKDVFCEICGKMFYHQKDLSTHKTIHTKERDKLLNIKPLKCQVCGKEYRHQIYLTSHMEHVHKSETDLVCDFCDEEFATAKELVDHRNTKHLEADKPYQCSFCKTCHSTLNNLLEHLKTHEDADMNAGVCELCDQPFMRKFDLKVHAVSHLSREELVQKQGNADQQLENCLLRCQICGKKFSRNFMFESHFPKHNMFEVAHCDFCDEPFTSAILLLDHRRKMHVDQPKPFLCTVCDERFEDNAKLVEHLQLHTERSRFNCLKCDMTFVRQHDLTIHKFVHNKARFACNLCPRSYQSRGSLVVHMRGHQGIFDYKCQYCEKQFKTSPELRHHERTHTKEQPWSCKYCGRRFSRSSTKIAHERIHTDERPYECTACGASFRLGSTLKNHVQRVHMTGGDRTLKHEERSLITVDYDEHDVKDIPRRTILSADGSIKKEGDSSITILSQEGPIKIGRQPLAIVSKERVGGNTSLPQTNNMGNITYVQEGGLRLAENVSIVGEIPTSSILPLLSDGQKQHIITVMESGQPLQIEEAIQNDEVKATGQAPNEIHYLDGDMRAYTEHQIEIPETKESYVIHVYDSNMIPSLTYNQ